MNKNERLNFCKICVNKKYDIKHGTVCGLTNMPPFFENSCSHFIKNASDELVLENDEQESFESENPPNYSVIIPVSRLKRFANFLIDLIAIQIIAFFFGLALTTVIIMMNIDTSFMLSPLFSYSLGGVIVLSYYIFFETLFGRTLGKFVTGTRVVKESGEEASFTDIVRRSIFRLIPFEALSFLFSDSGWHDTLSNTVVVSDRD